MNKKRLFIIISVIYVLIALILKPRHDYWSYLDQWGRVVSDGDINNPYGISYNLFAYISNLPLIQFPRAIFVVVYLVAAYEIWVLAANLKSSYLDIIFVVLLFNPLFIVFGLLYGSNDAFLSGITAISVFYFINKKYSLAGILMAIAIGFKFSPLFILPFFILKDYRINKIYAISFFISALLIILLGYSMWGDSILHPFDLGVNRESKSLSIFRFIRGSIRPCSFFGIDDLDSYSIWLLIVGFLISFLLFFYYKLDYLIMALFSYTNAMIFFKIGHHQFYFLMLLLSAIVFIKNENKIIENRGLFISFLLFWLWFFVLVILYYFTAYQDGYSYIREVVGLPNTVFLLVFNLFLLKLAFLTQRLSRL